MPEKMIMFEHQKVLPNAALTADEILDIRIKRNTKTDDWALC